MCRLFKLDPRTTGPDKWGRCMSFWGPEANGSPILERLSFWFPYPRSPQPEGHLLRSIKFKWCLSADLGVWDTPQSSISSDIGGREDIFEVPDFKGTSVLTCGIERLPRLSHPETLWTPRHFVRCLEGRSLLSPTWSKNFGLTLNLSGETVPQIIQLHPFGLPNPQLSNLVGMNSLFRVSGDCLKLPFSNIPGGVQVESWDVWNE